MSNWLTYYVMLNWFFRTKLKGLFRPFMRSSEDTLEKRTLEAAKRNSPVLVTISSQGGTRQGVCVNGVRIYVGTENTIALEKASEVVKRLKAQDFEVISDFASPKGRRRD